MIEKASRAAINAVNQASWGAHICQFYRTKEDLIEVLVPYFKAGLENNEFCMWVTSEPLSVEEAKASLKKAKKKLDYYIKKGQLEIIDATEWYTRSGKFEADKVLEGWVEKERQALEKGFDGLRVSGNTHWLGEENWRNFADYEDAINNVINKHRMIAICSYSLDKCGVSEIIDVVSNHQLALIKRENKWELIESSEHRQKENTFPKAIARLKILQQVTEAVHSTLDLKKVFKQITDGAVHTMGYTTALIVTLDDEKRHFEIKAVSTKKQLQPLIDKIVGFSLNKLTFPANPGTNAAFKSAMDGKIVVAKDLAEIACPVISKKKCSALQKLRKTQNYILLPLTVDAKVVGGVLISSSQEKVSEEELRTIKSFAQAASNAIKNAGLHTQTKLAEEALRKSEEKYKFLTDNTKEIILILSKSGKILFANKSALGNFGYSEEELIGKSIIHFLAKGSIRKALYALAQEFLGRPQPEMEIRAKTKSGEIRYLEVAEGSIPIYDKKKLIGVMINASDITERKQAYEELKNSEERLKILYEYAPDAYYLNDLKGNLIDGNRVAEQLTGYKKDELIGKNFLKLKLLPPGQIPKAASHLAKNALGQPSGPEEFVLNRKDGNQVSVEISTHPVKIKGKTLVLGLARDITDRKKTEEELWKSEMIYRALFEHANDAVFLLNFDGAHTAANKKAADMLGYSIEELISKSYKEIVVPHEHQYAREKLKGLLDGKTFPLYERIFRKKDGTEFRVELNVSLVRDAENRPLFIQSIARDITERKRAEEAIKKRNIQLELVHQVQKDIPLDMDIETILLSASESVGKLFGFDKVSVNLYDEDTDKIEHVVGWNKSGTPTPRGHKQKIGEGLIGKAAQLRETIVANDVSKEPSYVVYYQTKTKSELAIPLIVKNHMVGILDIQDTEKNIFKKDDVSTLQSIANYLAYIIEEKQAKEQIKASLNEKEVLLQEIHHRVKNNMQIISSLVKLQSRHITDNDALETFRSTQNRVRSMALIHERLYQSKDFARVDFDEYVRCLASNLFNAYTVAPGDINLRINIKDVLLDINTAIPCGLIINELVSNSLKHAFPNGKKGEIQIFMHPLNKNDIELTVSDNGVGVPENVDFRNTESLGLHLVTILAEDQLHGEIKMERNEGTKFHIRLRIRK